MLFRSPEESVCVDSSFKCQFPSTCSPASNRTHRDDVGHVAAVKHALLTEHERHAVTSAVERDERERTRVRKANAAKVCAARGTSSLGREAGHTRGCGKGSNSEAEREHFEAETEMEGVPQGLKDSNVGRYELGWESDMHCGDVHLYICCKKVQRRSVEAVAHWHVHLSSALGPLKRAISSDGEPK